MPILMRFEDGKSRALTLSFDDGVIQDKRTVEILNNHNLKATFFLNSGSILSDNSEPSNHLNATEINHFYSGHEVASHGVTHAFLGSIPTPSAVGEVYNDRRALEDLSGSIVRGFAYPSGSMNESTSEILRNCGIYYARTNISSYEFNIPDDWYRWDITCRFSDPELMQYTDSFLKTTSDYKYRPSRLFYVFCHSYEFDNGDTWHILEDFAEKIGDHKDIWYATNIDFYNYCKAFENLQISADERIIYNHSAIPVWFCKDSTDFCVQPGETLNLR